MPAQMLHLTVANEILKTLPHEDAGAFYLGAMSPDAIHMREGTDRNDKWITHLQLRDKQLWLMQVEEFVSKAYESENTDFLLGYASHILTDYCWIKEIFNGFKRRLTDDNLLESKDSVYYSELVSIDYELYLNCSFKDDVFPLIKAAKPCEVEKLLTAEEVDAWKHEQIAWFDTDRRENNPPLKYIMMEDVDEFIGVAAEFVGRRLA